ncbi:MAG TPA: helix-turn-helix domain-containing protein [Lachnospiraceae bacterium]|nr:helix-turn-helix domain-containing protein [Lachnospiraceae bacterium]
MTERNNHKHLTMSQRIIIEKGLENKESFAEIARKIRNVASQIFIAQLFALAT